MNYHLAEDTINRQDIDRLVSWLKEYPRLTKNQVTVEFEEKWSKWVGQEYSLHCNSGSSANLIMYYTLLISGRLKNKKVIVPSVGWVTSVAPAIQFGFEPIMCEADPDTFGLNLDELEMLLREHNPSTVMMVQVLGVPHKIDKILQLKEKYRFFLLEDSCAAIGAIYKGRKVGSFGDMASFSFYFGHQMSTIEGGMVSTNDREFINLLRMLRSHGWSKDLDHASHQALLVFYVPGFNVRSTDLNAWIGLGQLEKLDLMAQQRGEHHKRYCKLLGDRFYIQKSEPNCQIASISFGLIADNPEQRRSIVSALVKNGIETRIFSAGNLGLHPFWYERYGKASFPIADKIHHCGLFLPNHPALAESDIDFIARVVLNAA